MIFYPDRVELCGVTICDGPRNGRHRRILGCLREKWSDGSFIGMSSTKIAKHVELERGAQAVPGRIRSIRKHIRKAQRDVGIECGLEEVIKRTSHGYQLAACLTAQVSATKGNGRDRGHVATAMKHDEPKRQFTNDISDTNDPSDAAEINETGRADTGRTNLDVSHESEAGAAARQAWMIAQLTNGHRLKASDIVRKFACSHSTAERDLKALKTQGMIVFDGTTSNGHFRLKSDARLKASELPITLRASER